MMKILNKLIPILILLITHISCKKGSTSTPSSNTTTTESIEVTINGQTFSNTFPSSVVNLSGFHSTSCDNKPGYLNSIYDDDLNTQYSVITYIQHYKNATDFDSKSIGDYTFDGGPNPANFCHFTFYLRLSDKSQTNNNTTLLSGGKHTVTSVKTISNSNGKRQVLVEGSFSGTFKNSINTNIPVSGKYKKIVEIVN
jgi:hypothetical protein